MKLIRIIDNETIEIKELAKPNACFQTNEYPDNYDYCIFKETINPFVMYSENILLQHRIEKAIKTLKTLKGSARWERHLYEVDALIDILKGDTDGFNK